MAGKQASWLLGFTLAALGCGGGPATPKTKAVDLGGARPEARLTAARPVTRRLDGPCPQTLEGSPQRWRDRLQNADNPAAIGARLAELGLAALPEEEDAGAWKVSSVELREVPLAGPEPVDVWVEAWFTRSGESDDEVRAVRTAALLPLEGGAHCAMAGPEDVQSFTTHPCLGGPEQWPLAFHWVHVTDAGRFTLAVERSAGMCGGCGRSSEVSLELWEVRGAKLAMIFETNTLSLSYNGCPWPPTSTRGAFVEWVGAYPKELIVTSELWCSPMEDMPEHLVEACTPEATEARFRWKGGGYERASQRSLPAPLGAGLTVEEGGLDDGSGRGWAKRCAERLQQKKLDEARPACAMAAARASDPQIRGEALFGMALAAEAENDAPGACKLLAESLAARPGNAAVVEKKKAICK